MNKDSAKFFGKLFRDCSSFLFVLRCLAHAWARTRVLHDTHACAYHTWTQTYHKHTHVRAHTQYTKTHQTHQMCKKSTHTKHPEIRQTHKRTHRQHTTHIKREGRRGRGRVPCFCAEIVTAWPCHGRAALPPRPEPRRRHPTGHRGPGAGVTTAGRARPYYVADSWPTPPPRTD